MMRILHIAPIGHHSEGIGTVLRKLVPLQIEKGNEVKIVSVYKNRVYEKDFVYTIKKKKDFYSYTRSWRPEIVIFHSLYLKEYLAFSRVLNNEGIPYLLQLHGALSISNYKKHRLLKLLLNKLFYDKFIKDAKSIIYLNNKELDNAIVKEINPQSVIIPNGCDIHQISTKSVSDQTNLNIIYIGRIAIVHKGLDVLTEAVNTLRKDNPKGFHINVYGNDKDPDVKSFKLLLKGAEEYITFEGGVYGEEKDRVFQDSDIMILTSRFEGMPMGILEALSYGMPCIVTPGTNMAEVIKASNAGWVADLDSESIANTIMQATKEYRTNATYYKTNAHELSKQYDWQVIAEKSIDIYKKFIH